MKQFAMASLNIDRFVYDHFKAASADGTIVYPVLFVPSDAANKKAVVAAINGIKAQLAGLITADIKFSNDLVCVLDFDVLESAVAAKAVLQAALDKTAFEGGLRPQVAPGYSTAYIQSHLPTQSTLLMTMPAADVALLYIHLLRPAGPTRAAAALAGPSAEARAALVGTIPSSDAFKNAYKAVAQKEFAPQVVQGGLVGIDTVRAHNADVSFTRACDAEEPMRTFDLLLRAAHAGIAPPAAFRLATYTAGLLALPGEASVASLISDALTHQSLFVDQFLYPCVIMSPNRLALPLLRFRRTQPTPLSHAPPASRARRAATQNDGRWSRRASRLRRVRPRQCRQVGRPSQPSHYPMDEPAPARPGERQRRRRTQCSRRRRYPVGERAPERQRCSHDARERPGERQRRRHTRCQAHGRARLAAYPLLAATPEGLALPSALFA